jgi:hypothetical protein
MEVDASQPVANVIHQSSDLDTRIVKKVDFVAFIAMVINCTAQVSKNLENISAAEKSLGLLD